MNCLLHHNKKNWWETNEIIGGMKRPSFGISLELHVKSRHGARTVMRRVMDHSTTRQQELVNELKSPGSGPSTALHPIRLELKAHLDHSKTVLGPNVSHLCLKARKCWIWDKEHLPHRYAWRSLHCAFCLFFSANITRWGAIGWSCAIKSWKKTCPPQTECWRWTFDMFFSMTITQTYSQD